MASMHFRFHGYLVVLGLLLVLSSCQAVPGAAARSAPTAPAATAPLATPTASAAPIVTPTVAPSTTTPTAAPTLLPTPAPVTTTLVFVGVIVPARCVQASLDRLGDPDHPYKEVGPILSQADLTVGVYNAAMSDRIEQTGCQITYQLISRPNNAPAMARAGFDLLSVATNHIKDCGVMKTWCDLALFDTLENLHKAGLETVGAGNDLDEALQPVILTVNGVRFGFVSLGDSKMDDSVFAAASAPGIAFLNEENARRAVAAAQSAADVVIALPHWGSEYNQTPNWNQLEQTRYLVDAGVDLIVGNHAHMVQAVGQMKGVPVFFGLGNFVFDQDLHEQRQALILKVHFWGTRYVGYELIPTIGDRDGRAHVAQPWEAAQIMERVDLASLIAQQMMDK